MENKKYYKFNQLYKKVCQQIETYNDKPNPPGGNNIKHSDVGSITGNQCNFMNNKPVTDIGSITGNCTGKPIQEQAQAAINCGTGVQSSCNCGGENAALNTSSVLGPSNPSQSLANFCTANCHDQSQHNNTSGINTTDIKQIYSPALPYKKVKNKKYSRKYPLFFRFKKK